MLGITFIMFMTSSDNSFAHATRQNGYSSVSEYSIRLK